MGSRYHCQFFIPFLLSPISLPSLFFASLSLSLSLKRLRPLPVFELLGCGNVADVNAEVLVLVPGVVFPQPLQLMQQRTAYVSDMTHLNYYPKTLLPTWPPFLGGYTVGDN